MLQECTVLLRKGIKIMVYSENAHINTTLKVTVVLTDVTENNVKSRDVNEKKKKERN